MICSCPHSFVFSLFLPSLSPLSQLFLLGSPPNRYLYSRKGKHYLKLNAMDFVLSCGLSAAAGNGSSEEVVWF
jgi:hypothetical protein